MLSLMDLEPGWQTLAVAVQRRRARLGITQEEVASLGGPSSATVRKIEAAGDSSYRAKTLFELDDALGWRKGTSQELVEGPESWFGSLEDFVDYVVRYISDEDKRTRDYPVAPAFGAAAQEVARVRSGQIGEAIALMRRARDEIDQALQALEAANDQAQEQRPQAGGAEHAEPTAIGGALDPTQHAGMSGTAAVPDPSQPDYGLAADEGSAADSDIQRRRDEQDRDYPDEEGPEGGA